MFVFFAKKLQFFTIEKPSLPIHRESIFPFPPLSFFLRNEKLQYTDQVQFR